MQSWGTMYSTGHQFHGRPKRAMMLTYPAHVIIQEAGSTAHATREMEKTPLPESFGDAIVLGLLLLRRHLTLGNGPNQVDGELTAPQDRFV